MRRIDIVTKGVFQATRCFNLDLSYLILPIFCKLSVYKLYTPFVNLFPNIFYAAVSGIGLGNFIFKLFVAAM